MRRLFTPILTLLAVSLSAQVIVRTGDKIYILPIHTIDSITFPSPSSHTSSGTFQVSATKYVHFSSGNLQYTPSTDTWAFAAEQYEFFGSDNVSNSDLAYEIDLFGWSAEGNNAPWGANISDDAKNYLGDFADWGQNIQNDTALYHTLTTDEWAYLIGKRENASSLYGIGRIDLSDDGKTYANGLFLLPDDWVSPEGITFSSGFSDIESVEAFGTKQTFTLEQWRKMEAAGAVFLPAAGVRQGAKVSLTQEFGYYWTATAGDNTVTAVDNTETAGNNTATAGNENDQAYVCSFQSASSQGTSRTAVSRAYGYSVRLVWGLAHGITIAATAHGTITTSQNGTTTTSQSRCVEGETVTLTVTPDSGYQLKDNTLTVTYIDTTGEEQTVPTEYHADTTESSTSGTYTFTMPTGDVTVTADFEQTSL